jgi:hypothetical protein
LSAERPGIYGSETEYAVLYIPDDPSDRHVPPFETIEPILVQALLSGRKAALSSGLKGGYFLQNGGLIHFEIFLRSQGDTPILEASTPECRSPRDLLAYQRAFDRILVEASTKCREPLLAQGFAGRISFGKNNRDARGIGYGTHENYLVYQKTGLADRLAVTLAAPFVIILLVPSLLLILGILAAVICGSSFALIFPRQAAAIQDYTRGRFWRVLREVRALYFILMNVFLFLPVLLYSLVLRVAAFRPFREDLPSFLATRQIFTGAGGLDPRTGAFEIAQRPALIGSLAEIVMFGRRKTIFDLKGLLYDPLAVFRPMRKMAIASGDSNLSDFALLLNIGTTALVIEMIEAGVDLSDLRLRRPIRALREVSRGGPWKELMVRGVGHPDTPGRRTAIDIQREYLRRAREHFAARPEGRPWRQEVLALWQEVLDDLSEKPASLADRIDWVAKKNILDAAILPGGWTSFVDWARILLRITPGRLASSRSLEEAIEGLGPLRRLLLRREVRKALRNGEIDPGDFIAARDRHLEALKIDLRYHEIGEDPGYGRMLEARGHIRRIATDEEIHRAVREPPPDTRARIRGYYIALAHGPETIRANWNSVELKSMSRLIALPDPFQCKIPSDN